MLLSQAQKRVLIWLGKGWQAQPARGDVFTINGGGARQGLDCRRVTLNALRDRGLVEQLPCGSWGATALGKED